MDLLEFSKEMQQAAGFKPEPFSPKLEPLISVAESGDEAFRRTSDSGDEASHKIEFGDEASHKTPEAGDETTHETSRFEHEARTADSGKKTSDLVDEANSKRSESGNEAIQRLPDSRKTESRDEVDFATLSIRDSRTEGNAQQTFLIVSKSDPAQ
jgi:hypothetical protein